MQLPKSIHSRTGKSLGISSGLNRCSWRLRRRTCGCRQRGPNGISCRNAVTFVFRGECPQIAVCKRHLSNTLPDYFYPTSQGFYPTIYPTKIRELRRILANFSELLDSRNPLPCNGFRKSANVAERTKNGEGGSRFQTTMHSSRLS